MGDEMAQTPRELSRYESARHFFGAELRHWRELRGLSQERLASLVFVSGDLVGKVEIAERWPTAALAHACDEALQCSGVLVRLHGLVEHQRTANPRANPVVDPLTVEAIVMKTLAVVRELAGVDLDHHQAPQWVLDSGRAAQHHDDGLSIVA
jgi:transcriptional regulator with XRE-family HTH domain